MSRVRSSMILLGICVIALLIGTFRLAMQRAPLPTGSTYSTEPNGSQALYTWIETVGGSASRLQEAVIRDDHAPQMLVVLQPESAVDSSARDAFDAVARRGGTLVVAGDSLPWLLYVRNLGVTVDPIRNGADSAMTPDNALTLPILSRYRLRAEGATPLLVDPAGDPVALRVPYKSGSLVVIATPVPLLNQALRDEQTTRFVYRELVSRSPAIAFDEVHHTFAPTDVAGAPMTVNGLLFNTSPGRAVIYVAVLAFFYLLLSGRRLGPPLPARAPSETRRTMFEHVQMLANLYRRAGQFSVVRAALTNHFRRERARGMNTSARDGEALGDALARIEVARNESELISAVAAAPSSSRQRSS